MEGLSLTLKTRLAGTKSSRKLITEWLDLAGIQLNGPNPWDIQVKNEEFFNRVLAGGSLALGEAFMDGWWDVEQLDDFFHRLFIAGIDSKPNLSLLAVAQAMSARFINRQSKTRATEVADAHYNIGNDLYRAMLGQSMSYTCAYWKSAKTLDQAQEAKLDLICRKLNLKPGMTVLEYGCGWGTFSKFAAERYGAQVLGVNVAEEQLKLGRELCKGLTVELRRQDYREVTGKFDRVVSVGIMEHVGYKNYRNYMECAARCLKDDGIAFIHTIGGNVSTRRCDPWFDKYIFPNGMTPSISQLSKAMEGIFVMEDWHNIGPHYDPTLIAWWNNFDAAWPSLRPKYGDRFYRMWKYYLLILAAYFRSRRYQLWQIVMTKPGRAQSDFRYA